MFADVYRSDGEKLEVCPRKKRSALGDAKTKKRAAPRTGHAIA